MKGIVLAGGTGTRLMPLTKITNKHLLPVYDRPMIYYPIQTLVEAGVKDIMVVTGGEMAGEFLRLLGNGEQFGLRRLHYTYQEKPGGIAEALSLAEDFVGFDLMTVILGDNILVGNISRAVISFEKQVDGAKVLLKEVDNPESYGVALLKNGKILSIEEKPSIPQSKFAVIGVYMYDHNVFQKIRTLSPSARGELEITDLNNFYIQSDQMSYETFEGWWIDAGESIDGLLEANNLMAKISCAEKKKGGK